jgi:hypothetical protein
MREEARRAVKPGARTPLDNPLTPLYSTITLINKNVDHAADR